MSVLLRFIKVMLNASKVLAAGMVKQLLDILMEIALIAFQRQDIITLLGDDLSRDFRLTKRIVRGDAVGQIQEGFQPFLFGDAVVLNLNSSISATNHCTDRHQDNIE